MIGLTRAADLYVRAVDVVRVIDGDTVVCDVDLGFYVKVRMSCRLVGLNCNELNEPGGPEARAELERLLALGPVSVQSVHADKFAGRFDGVVVVTTADRVLNVNASLIADGFAVVWGGAGPKPHVPWPRVQG